MQLKLPVDVHLAVGDDGSLVLLVGGLMFDITPDDLAKTLRSKPLENGRRKKVQKTVPAAAPAAVPAPKIGKGPAESRAKRRAKGLCSWCDRKPVPGKKLCEKHLVGARKAARSARAVKEKRTK